MYRSLALIFLTLPLYGATYFVNNSGSPSCSDTGGQSGAIGAPFCTITYGATRMAGGDTLNVQAGTYSEAFIFVTGLIGSSGSPSTIQNYQNDSVIIDCGSTASGRVRINGGTKYLTFQGFTVTDCDHGIFVDGVSDHITIQNNTVHDTGQEGIHIASNTSVSTVQNNVIYNTNGALAATNGEGIYIGLTTQVDNTNNITVLNNTIHDTSDECIELKGGTHDIIVDGNSCTTSLKLSAYNSSFNVGVIEVDEAANYAFNPNHIIRNNTVHDTHTGLQLGTGCTTYNNIVYGTDTNTGFWGMFARNGASDSYSRTFYHNTIAISSVNAISSSGSPTIDSKNNLGPNTTNNLTSFTTYYVNAAGGNFHLVSGSPPIGAGLNLNATVPTDKDGKTRTNPPDIGAYQATVKITSITVTPTQMVLSYVAPDANPCQIKVSTSASLSPLVHDVDSTLFPGSDQDSRAGALIKGTSHYFVVGTRDVEPSTGSLRYSRALEQLTTHYIQIGCGGGFLDTVSTQAITAYPTYNRSVRDPHQIGSDEYPVTPTFTMSDTTQRVIEPMTGARMELYGSPEFSRNMAIGVVPTCRLGTNWTPDCTNISTYTGTTQDWLEMVHYTGPGETIIPESFSTQPGWERLNFTGLCTGANVSSADCTVQLCLTYNGATCDSAMFEKILTTSPQTISMCDKNGGNSCVIGDLWGTYRSQLQYNISQVGVHGAGFIYTSVSATTTINYTLQADCTATIVNDFLRFRDDNFTTWQGTILSTNCSASPPNVTIDQTVTLSTTAYKAPGYPFYYSDSPIANRRYGVLVRKKSTTASNTITISTPTFDSDHIAQPPSTSAGYNEYCSQYPIVGGPNDGYRMCRNSIFIYAYNQTTGDIHFFGKTEHQVFDGQDICQQIGDGSTLWDSSTTYVTVCGEFAAPKPPAVFRVVFGSPTYNGGNNYPSGTNNESSVSSVTYVDLSGSLPAALHTYDTTFDSTTFAACSYSGISSNRYFMFNCNSGSQDSFAWFAVYDLQTLGFVAAWPSWRQPSGTRWGVNHAVFWIAPQDGQAASVNLFGVDLKEGRDDNPTSYGSGRYHFKIWDNLSASSTTFPISTFIPISPINPSTWQSITAGDVFDCNQGIANDEQMQIVSTNPATQITVTRGYGGSSGVAQSSGTDCVMTPHFNTNETNQFNNSGQFWDFISSPTGPGNTSIFLSVCPGGGHAFYYPNDAAGSASISGQVFPLGISTTSFPLCSTVTFSNTLDQPLFANKAYANFAGEGHPGFKPTPYPFMVDTHPNAGTDQQTSITWIAGTLFKVGFNENPHGASPNADGLSRKYLPQMAASEGRYFKDISGPSSTITATSTDYYHYCIAQVANECQTGSSTGDIYANMPGLNPSRYQGAQQACDFFQSTQDDFCFQDDNEYLNTVSGYIVPSTSATVTLKGFPIVEQVGQPSKGNPNTANSKAFWGPWVYTGFVSAGHDDYYKSVLIKAPSTAPPNDGIDRTTFSTTTITITAVPANTNNVVVDFGYQEFGLPTDYYCTSRREKCMAYSSVIISTNPFMFPVEGAGGVESGVSGVSCASGCTVIIPTIPNDIVFSRVRYRDASNNTLSTEVLPPAGGAASGTGGGGGTTTPFKLFFGNGTISGGGTWL